MTPKTQLSLADQLGIKPDANRATDAIVCFLNYNGWKVWRQNNTGVYDQSKGVWRKPNNGLKGIPDIIGFRKSDATFIGVEIKVGQDRLSPEQIQFLNELKQANGISMVAHSFDDFLTKYETRFKP